MTHLEQIFNEKEKKFTQYGQAFVNAPKAKWGDTFLFLKIAHNHKWLVIIFQSKRRAAKEEQRRKQLLEADLQKVLGEDYNAFAGSKFEYLYIFLTDCMNIEEITIPKHVAQHVCIITRNEHKEFYGEYRQKLRDLRDLAAYTRPKKAPVELNLTKLNLQKLTIPQLKKALKERQQSTIVCSTNQLRLTLQGKEGQPFRKTRQFS
jgi:hypothetical protein